MAPKVPSAKVLEAQLSNAVEQLFRGDRANLSVNAARSHAESQLGLDEGFFKQANWKDRSKQIIKNKVDELEATETNGAAPSSQVSAPPEKKKKRSTPEQRSPARKRQKITKKMAKAEEAETDEELSKEPTETPLKERKPPKKKTTQPKKNRKVLDSDEEAAAAEETTRPQPSKAGLGHTGRRASLKKSYKEKSSSEEDEEAMEEELPAEEKIREPPADSSLAKAPSPAAKPRKLELSDGESPLSELDDEDLESRAGKEVKDDSSSELSEIIDEPPKRKQKSKEPSAKSTSKPKSSAKSTSDVSPDEAEIKKLQGQLVKCGIRKIWAFELKKYGEDNKAKIGHLKGMLRDIGMDGRFSEAKAREIKERRELEADLAAVTEMNRNWGASERNGRASRSRAAASTKKHYTVDGDSEDEGEDRDPDAGHKEDDGESAGEESGVKVASGARGRGLAKYRADLAFLNDESESD